MTPTQSILVDIAKEKICKDTLHPTKTNKRSKSSLSLLSLLSLFSLFSLSSLSFLLSPIFTWSIDSNRKPKGLMLFDRYRKAKRQEDAISPVPTSKKSSLAGALFRRLPQALARKGWTQQQNKKSTPVVVLSQPRQSLSLPNITLQAVVSPLHSDIPCSKDQDRHTLLVRSPSAKRLSSDSSATLITSIPTVHTLQFDFNSKRPSFYDVLGAQLDFVTTKRMLKRHSAEQYPFVLCSGYSNNSNNSNSNNSNNSNSNSTNTNNNNKPAKRARQSPIKRHSYTYGALADILPRLTTEDLVCISAEKRERSSDLLRITPPQRSISQQVSSQQRQVVPTPCLSTSVLPQKQVEPPASHPLSPEALSTMLTMTSGVVLIDVRSLMDYQNKRIQNSLNVNLPSLLIKRYQRGAVCNFNIENFITTPEGKEHYGRHYGDTPGLVWVVYDEEMNEDNRTSQAWTLLSVLERATHAKGSKVHYLSGGFKAFEGHEEHLHIVPMTPLPAQLTQVLEDEEGLLTCDASPRTESDFGFVISEIIPGFLYVGPEIETTEHADQLERRHIRRVLNMAEECHDNVAILHERVVYRKIATRDTVEMKNVDWVMTEAVDFIENAKRHHEPIYVHCKAGKSRSITAILAYLVSSERWTLRQAYCHVIKARPNMSPNIGFIAELMKIEGRVHGRVSSFMETDWQSTALHGSELTHEIQELQYAWQHSPLEAIHPVHPH
ncbi:hypothetical protein BDF14DRAFT_1971143 [Spinellus fusiger]|nr:hypothetical protein BDF14DRAFT_1971143 [Spinellus fusiger]